MERFTRRQQLGLGVIAIELGLVGLVGKELIHRPKFLDAPRGQVSAAVHHAVSDGHKRGVTPVVLDEGVDNTDDNTEEVDVAIEPPPAPPSFTLTVPPAIKTGLEQLVSYCSSGNGLCAMPSRGFGWPMPLPKVEPAPVVTMTTLRQIPVPTEATAHKLYPHPGFGPKHGTLTVNPVAKKPKKDFSKDMAQLVLQQTSDFIRDIDPDKVTFSMDKARMLLTILNDVSIKADYAENMLRMLNTNCEVFVNEMTVLVNQYAIRPTNTDNDAGTSAEVDAAYLSWTRGLLDLGFIKNSYGAYVWENVPLTLQQCDPSTDIAQQ